MLQTAYLYYKNNTMSPDHMDDELALRELYQQYVNLYNEDPQDMLSEDQWIDEFNKL